MAGNLILILQFMGEVIPVGAFTNEDHNDRNRYKMFVDDKLRKVVSNALVRQLVDAKLILPNPKIT